MSSTFTKMVVLPLIIFIPLVSLSINSTVILWMLMEISTLSFVILLSLSSPSFIKWGSNFNYFLIQAFSSTLLVPLLFTNLSEFIFNNYIVSLVLLLKLGIAPFHSWVPWLMNNMSWMNCFIMTTIQKIIPLILLNKFIEFNLILTLALISIIIAGMLIIKSTSLKKIMAYSSISNSGWMILIMNFNFSMTLTYLMIYTFLSFLIFYLFNKFNINSINDFNKLNFINTFFKMLLVSLLMSIGGLPPFTGFMMKMTAISSTKINSFFWAPLMILALVNIWWYLIICMSFILNSEPSSKTWMNYPLFSSIKIITVLSLSVFIFWILANSFLVFN